MPKFWVKTKTTLAIFSVDNDQVVLEQHGFKAESGKQMIDDYPV